MNEQPDLRDGIGTVPERLRRARRARHRPMRPPPASGSLAGFGAHGIEGALATALGNVSNAVIVTDTDGRIVWVNPAFCRMSGYTPADALGNTPRILKSGVQDDAYYAWLWATILDGRPWRGEVVERHKDRSFYTVEQTITPLLDDQGRPAYFVAIHDDVTELRASQARLQALFDHALDAIVLFDDLGRYVDGNPAASTLLGYEPHEFLGMSLVDVVADTDLERFVGGWADFLIERQQRSHYNLRHRDGHLVEVEFQAVADIVPGTHLAIAREVTART
jgi:PAS domain S-box-containing protein